jgi:hypothetical protein
VGQGEGEFHVELMMESQYRPLWAHSFLFGALSALTCIELGQQGLLVL